MKTTNEFYNPDEIWLQTDESIRIWFMCKTKFKIIYNWMDFIEFSFSKMMGNRWIIKHLFVVQKDRTIVSYLHVIQWKVKRNMEFRLFNPLEKLKSLWSGTSQWKKLFCLVQNIANASIWMWCWMKITWIKWIWIEASLKYHVWYLAFVLWFPQEITLIILLKCN